MSNDFGGKKRSELPDSVFGIPQERKYPMPDEKHGYLCRYYSIGERLWI